MDKIYILGLDVSTSTIGISLFEDLGDNGSLQILTHLSPKISSKITNSIEKLCLKSKEFEDYISNFITKLVESNHKLGYSTIIKKVIIEEPLLGSNNIATVGTLIRFNGFITKYIYDKFNIIPDYVSSYDARSFAFPELVKVRKIDTKGNIISDKKIMNSKPVLFGDYVLEFKNIKDSKNNIDKFHELPDNIKWLYEFEKNKNRYKLNKKKVVWLLVNKSIPNIEWAYDKNKQLIKETFDCSDACTCVLGYMKMNKYWK